MRIASSSVSTSYTGTAASTTTLQSMCGRCRSGVKKVLPDGSGPTGEAVTAAVEYSRPADGVRTVRVRRARRRVDRCLRFSGDPERQSSVPLRRW
jgi:hypothetical protein